MSEESGLIRFAEGGQLSEPVARERVEAELTERLTRSTAIVNDVVATARAAANAAANTPRITKRAEGTR